ncbi:MAG: HAMP domain-containing histidine kinase [Microcoleus sp. PH2017_10_PVI_O_A]|uniref:ATP-binding response regulator n=1 Tax=unclassified Microcoleus TaxID=2642155 RepID=UPI001DEE0E93|nr:MULTISPECIES: HAMP domain-containing sensor histidine kinase [unclassified Microcoleus]TAE73622.1 MAG: sensor histidine kinase [Oscillatoriales cyanobacterium]MCC3409934.1 HAMP domain-containing histidine kinase [Microcoleus sp. PH2017_10_PVI_O_A]MCC3464182.1 HAMP domain-containing histidine kinase [Microcoleus sp. PH2017_11_PCY_U_A]MCC3482527.1 HAMP domain-containing histidine kinase [Microcoleus sp. PH2017_12_PCY_D_A]MCC3563529.1 HAMP domain-containing histidine kinase [Microcoleus sp. PH
MSQILLLVEQRENRRLLLEWLAVHYEVLLPNLTENIDEFLPLNQSFDMGIVDGLALKRHGQWIAAQKQAEQPMCLPFLLITSRSDVGMATRFIWQTIDDLIIAPIEKIELQARVEILLRARQLSLTLKLSHDQIDRTLQTAKELNDMKTSLLYMIAHDVRNPLNFIIGTTQVLTEYKSKLTDEKTQQLLDKTQAAAKGIDQLLDDVLLLGRVESGKIALCLLPLDLAKFCNELVAEFQSSLKLKPQNAPVTLIFVNHCQSATACLEASLLRRILSNLLSNAIKYSPPNTQVIFELKLTETEAIFSVQDAGIGIPLADQERLFNSFFRAKNVGVIPGTGLGLSIVKKCVDLHGGEIALSSEEGVGSTFTVTLPIAQIGEEQVSPATP